MVSLTAFPLSSYLYVVVPCAGPFVGGIRRFQAGRRLELSPPGSRIVREGPCPEGGVLKGCQPVQGVPPVGNDLPLRVGHRLPIAGRVVHIGYGLRERAGVEGNRRDAV